MEPFLRGKVAVVCGGGRGIGAASATTIAAAGAAVTLAARTGDDIRAVARQIREADGRAIAVETDVVDADDVDELIERTLDAFGGIDVVVYTAADLGPAGRVTWEASPDAWKKAIDVNLTGAFMLAHAALPHMLDAGWGRLIFLSSPFAWTPVPGASAYCATKAALNQFTRVVACEVAGTGVIVKVVNPPPTDTEMLRDFRESMVPERFLPRRRALALDPRAAAAMVLWLCTPAARFARHVVSWTDPPVQRAAARVLDGWPDAV